MKPEKLATNLEKIISKLENVEHHFANEDYQTQFDSMKSDTIALLEEMAQLLHEDAEESDNHEEDDKL